MALMLNGTEKILISNNNFAVEIYRISYVSCSERGNNNDINWNNKLKFDRFLKPLRVKNERGGHLRGLSQV